MRSQKPSDSELVKKAKRGDQAAFGELVRRYESKIYRLARRMTSTDQDAEDVVQEAFIKAYRSLGEFKEKSKFSTWLYRITVNLSLMKLRRRRPEVISLDQRVPTEDGDMAMEIEDRRADPLRKLIEKERSRILDMAIDSLSPSYRAVFVLRHVEGFSTQETARILKTSVAAVKSRLHRARLALQEKLFDYMSNHTKRRLNRKK